MPPAHEERGVLRDLPPEALPPRPEPEPPAVWSRDAAFWITLVTGPSTGFVLAALNARALRLQDRARSYALAAGVTFVLELAYLTWVDATSNPLARNAPNAFLNLLLVVPAFFVALYVKDRVPRDVDRYRIRPDDVVDVRTRPWVHALVVGTAIGLALGVLDYVILRALRVPWAF